MLFPTQLALQKSTQPIPNHKTSSMPKTSRGRGRPNRGSVRASRASGSQTGRSTRNNPNPNPNPPTGCPNLQIPASLDELLSLIRTEVQRGVQHTPQTTVGQSNTTEQPPPPPAASATVTG